MCRPKAFYTDKTALASAVASGAITEAAAASITPTLDQIKMCVSIDNKDGCNNNQECQWGVVKGEDVPTTDPATPVKPTDPSTPAGETPLFTKEFCHPREIDAGKAEQEFAECLPNPKDNCNGSCVWSNGIDLIPDSDFCAPIMMTDDIQTIVMCVSADESSCADPCKWRKGKQAPVVDPSTPTQPQVGRCQHKTAPISGTTDICKPVTTKDACYNKDLQGACEWTYAPVVDPATPVDPVNNQTDPVKPPVVDPSQPRCISTAKAINGTDDVCA